MTAHACGRLWPVTVAAEKALCKSSSCGPTFPAVLRLGLPIKNHRTTSTEQGAWYVIWLPVPPDARRRMRE
jgi:hypothetical protein